MHRTKALKWWTAMSFDEQKAKVQEHHKDILFGCIATSPLRIEGMWKIEQGEKKKLKNPLTFS